MLVTIQNDQLELTVDTLGAQMMNLRYHQTEYLWQGDPAYWGDRAPNLFPFIGRLTNKSYRYHGKEYPMGIHGFAAKMEFTVAEKNDHRLVMSLSDNEETRKQYPFSFDFRVIYTLEENRVDVTFEVHNRSDETMPFGIGGHPGFRVPLSEVENFTDYLLEFSQECQPDRIYFTPTVYLSGRSEPFPLEDNCRIRLHHDLFDDDALIFQNMARSITLRSEKTGHGVTVDYPQMPYFGVWQMAKVDAPYLCLEPWSSLPARQDIVEEISCKSDLIHLPAGETYLNQWSITLF